MDSSENFYWPSNGTDNGMLQSPISLDGYIPQQDIAGTPRQESNSPKSSPMIASSPQDIPMYRRQSDDLCEDKVKNETIMASGLESNFSVGIVNPDAIEPKPRSYTCRICQVTFPSKSAVTVHSRLHTDHEGKPYRCTFCGKGFSTNFYLKQHERIHSGQKPYKCPMCENSFKQLSHVQQHVRTHTGVRPYKCHWPGCGKAFLQQSHLKSHEARHTPKPSTGIRPFKCHWPDCGKSFAQLTNLKSHVARHTPGKAKRKGSNAMKKSESSVNDEVSGSSFNFQNVINQAAAAANIVPEMLADEEAAIRPFLCPGCSKLYVREATFKKHLEECKTKLQMSISATASALGIEPPPMPSSGVTLSDYEPSLIQIASITSQSTAMKRPHIDNDEEDEEEQSVSGIDAQTTLQHARNAQNRGVNNTGTPVTTIQDIVKKEVVSGETANFVSRPHLLGDSEFKMPQVLSNAPIYSELPLTMQNTVLIQNDQAKQQHMLVSQQNNSINPHLPDQNQMITTSVARVLSSAPLGLSQSAVTSQSLILTSNDSSRNSPTSEHSTINQAAIRWQWDQSVPKLDFP